MSLLATFILSYFSFSLVSIFFYCGKKKLKLAFFHSKNWKSLYYANLFDTTCQKLSVYISFTISRWYRNHMFLYTQSICFCTDWQNFQSVRWVFSIGLCCQAKLCATSQWQWTWMGGIWERKVSWSKLTILELWHNQNFFMN